MSEWVSKGRLASLRRELVKAETARDEFRKRHAELTTAALADEAESDGYPRGGVPELCNALRATADASEAKDVENDRLHALITEAVNALIGLGVDTECYDGGDSDVRDFLISLGDFRRATAVLARLRTEVE